MIRTLEVDVAGLPVRVLRAGPERGPTVVLVHGLGLGAGMWRYHLERLGAAGCDVVAPDMPGFGRSPGPLFGQTVEHAADWLAAFADALRLGRVLWVGHSVSAQYALRLAVVRPDHAAGLVLAAPTGEPGPFRWLAQLVGLARGAFRESGALATRVLAHYLTTFPSRTVGAWLGARRHLALDDAARAECPIRVVLGGRDTVVPRAFAERMTARAPRAELVMIPESAHGVALSPPEPFCRVLLDFVPIVFPQSAVENDASARGERVD